MRIAFALSGFHRHERGAEIALLAVADELARTGDEVTVFGAGEPRPGLAYDYRHVSAVSRERFEGWPRFPPFRNETMWEDATFATALLAQWKPTSFDAAITCAFPFTHLALRRPTWSRSAAQVFVTQNGDWPAFADQSEYRLFRCDGLVCTNPDYFERNKRRWPCALIPNGIDLARFGGGPIERTQFGLASDRRVVLMVSALIDSKRVLEGISAVARHPNAQLVVAGDGPLREEAAALAARLLPGRFTRVTLSALQMPSLYRAADAFLHMSLLESFGNVFVEAMASGLPIVAHDTARLRWIVGNDEPLCNTENPAALDEALHRALSAGRSPLPNPRAGRFAWSRIAAEYREFLATLIAAKV